MRSKNTIAATLAILALIGFLVVFAFLALNDIPAANKDYFNTALIALIGFVGTGIGYFLGSSNSSAQKNDILAQVAAPPAAPPGGQLKSEGGFVNFLLLAQMFLLGAALLMIVSACAHTNPAVPSAGDSPQVLAGKSLLAVKSTIVTAGLATDGLCRAGALPADKCAQAKAAYELAKPAYDAAVDAYLLMQSGGGGAASFEAALERVQALAADLLRLSGGAQ